MWLLFKNVLFTVVVPGTVVLWLPTLFVEPGSLISFSGWVYFACIWDFARTGRGTPAPIDPPKRLVVRGVYRWVRNPMYLAVWSALIGEILLYGSRNLLVYLGAVAVGQ